MQTLKLLFQFSKITQKLKFGDIQIDKGGQDTEVTSFTDRYYRALYELLLRLHLNKAAKLDEFFGLIFKSIKADLSIPRAIAFIKRLLQLCYINEVTYTAACMLIISEVFKNRDDVKYAWYSVANNKFDNG